MRILPDLSTNVVSLPSQPRRGRAIQVDVPEILRLYDQNISLDAIAEKVGCSIQTVRNHALKNGRKPRRTRGTRKSIARHSPHTVDEKAATMPPVNHPALASANTIYPATVTAPSDHPRCLIPGENNRKIGGLVQKGKWQGLPIFTLTLEERATCPTSCRHWRSCVVPETKVLTADLRWVEIGSLAVGDRIVGFDEYPADGERRKTRIATVEALGRDTLPCFEVVTDKGTVIATADHRWVSRPRKRKAIDPNYHYHWRRTDALAPGEEIQFLSEPWEQDTSYDAARLRGFIEGDGYVSTWDNAGFPKTRTGWSQVPGQLCDEISAIATAKGFTVQTKNRVSGVNHSTVSLCEINGGFRETWRFLGTIRPTRLLDKAEDAISDHVLDGRGSSAAKVIKIRPLPKEREIVTIATSTKTLITNGLLSHNCYGNSMHWSKRFKAGDELEKWLPMEVAMLMRANPQGIVVRLHVLGDFYSVEYVRLWARLLDEYPGLHVFGFTARIDPDDPITRELVELATARWDRFAMRFSNAPMELISTVSIEHPVQKPADAIICPAQQGQTSSCGTCGLCWQSKKRIAFLQH